MPDVFNLLPSLPLLSGYFFMNSTSSCTVVVFVVVGCFLDPFQLLIRTARPSLFLGYWYFPSIYILEKLYFRSQKFAFFSPPISCI